MIAMVFCDYTFMKYSNKVFFCCYALRGKRGKESVGLILFLEDTVYKHCNFAHNASPPLSLYLFYIKDSNQKAWQTSLTLISVIIATKRRQLWVSIT